MPACTRTSLSAMVENGSLRTRRTRPATNELMCKVPRAVDAKNESDQISAHHQQYVKHSASRAHVTVPPPVPKLQHSKRIIQNGDAKCKHVPVTAGTSFSRRPPVR